MPPPVVTLTAHPASRTGDNTPTFGFEASQPATFTCAIDGGASHACSSPYTVPTPLADGSHEFEVDAVSGNSVIGTASFSFTVDTVAPAITLTKSPPAFTTETAPTFAFKASEPASFTCAIDGGISRACASSYTAPSPLADGPHHFEVTATDQVGNSSHVEVSFTVDTTAPTISFTERPAEQSADKRPRFGFEASEPATFTCAIDGAAPQSCASPYVAPTSLPDGSHSFVVTAVDQAGNAGQASVAFTIDTKPPQTFIAGHPPKLIRTRRDKVREDFRFRSNEAGATFVCRVDNDPLRFCAPRISRRFEVGRHTIKVRARDAAGNVDRTPAVFHFRVKRVG